MKLLAASRHFAVIGVVFGIIAALAAFGFGAYKTVDVVLRMIQGHTEAMTVALVQIMDGFLLAAGLLIFALGLYQVFIGEMALPPSLVIRDLDGLKSKMIGVVILVMAVSFMERLETREDPREILYAGVAVALVIAALVWYRRD